MDKIVEFIKFLKNSSFSQKIKDIREIDGKEEKTTDIPSFLSERLKEFLKNNGINSLYLHQVEGLERLKEGKNIIITTPTGSGKTLIYNLFILNEMLKDPSIKALYIFPTKALTQNQLKILKEFNLFPCEIYDGDTPEEKRKKIKRNFPSFILTNPDMLHMGILHFHERWRNFFSNLKFIVIDEVHIYRGIFGSQVAHIIRRLRRICNLYGSNPKFILSSATIKDSENFAEQLTGVKFTSISESSSGAGKRYFLFFDPGFDSPYNFAIPIITESLKFGLSTIVFTKSRKTTELLQRWIVEKDPYLFPLISSYRAGYLPEERREIEKALFEGNLKGVIATSALELGIDIGNLDCCILFGYPGSITSTWQRIGRVGRGKKDSIVIFIALQDALDQYFLRNPDEFFKRSCEDVIINFENEIIASSHLKCASIEIPLSKEDRKFYPESILKIAERGEFLTSKDGKLIYYIGKNPHREINLRSIGEVFSIIELSTEKIIGEIEEDKVFYECHPGAIYLHRGKKYEVIFIDFERKRVVVEKKNVDYYTQPGWWEEIEIISEEKHKKIGKCDFYFGTIEVTKQITEYEKRREKDKTLISRHQLHLPPQKFKTQSLWLEIPEEFIIHLKEKNYDPHGSIHATEHSIIGIFPVEITCDRWDIGGYSFPFHKQTEKPTIFIYDGYPGGVGISKKGFERIWKILLLARECVEKCKCENGCPSCIQSPKCGNNNRPLDKKGCIELLKIISESSI